MNKVIAMSRPSVARVHVAFIDGREWFEVTQSNGLTRCVVGKFEERLAAERCVQHLKHRAALDRRFR